MWDPSWADMAPLKLDLMAHGLHQKDFHDDDNNIGKYGLFRN